jgi:glycosyltransferase involved in cell wall biosynthesis
VDRVIVVDDASSDQTWSELRGLKDRRVIRVRRATNSGVGAAIVSGYRRAIVEDADWIAVMAGDDQMDPADLSRLLEASHRKPNVDYVKGNRFLHADYRKMPFLRRLGSRTLSWLTRRCTRLEVGDCQCGYTLIRASTAAALPLGILWPRYGYPNDLLALLAQDRRNVEEVAVRPVYKDERSGLHPGHVLSIAVRILRRRALQGTPRAL